MSTIQLFFPRQITKQSLIIAAYLYDKGYDVILNAPFCKEENLSIAVFEKDMDVEKYLSEIRFLKDQLEYSSLKHLRILPCFIYDGTIDDPEELFEGPTGEFVEAIFSGEFKPYGWDMSRHDNIDELVRIIEENYAQ